MVKRRSLDDGLTPEEESFLNNETKKPLPKIKPKPETKEEPPMPRPVALKENFIQESSPTPQPQRAAQSAPASAGTGAINARIDPVITTALLRASVERRIEGKDLSTQREIIAAALTEWLKKNGYWKNSGLS